MHDPPGEIAESTTLTTAQNTDRKRQNGESHTLRSLFAASSSAGDLRSLDLQKDVDHPTSPKGVLEGCRSGGAGMTMDSPTKDSPLGSSTEKPLSHWRKVVRQWKDVSVKRFSTLPKIHGKKGKRGPSWKEFSSSEMYAATNHFSEENLIGRGGNSEVYKGCLPNGQLVAVKRLIKGSLDEKNKTQLTELGIIAHLDHQNTAKLLGCGIGEEVYIVLQLSSLGSLGSILQGSREDLDWDTRYKVALGIAEGLIYLHKTCPRKIIHRDIKSDNILLAENHEPQICDFGLALWLKGGETNCTEMKQEGTFGYIAPEYVTQGLVNEKTDVFSFGIVLLELITGRRALDNSNKSILIWANPLMHKKKLEHLVDPILGDNYSKEELERMVLTAALCVDTSQSVRPEMSQVIILLKGDEFAEATGKPQMKRAVSEDLFNAKEYNSTKYLNDIRKHKQVAFDSNSDVSTISPPYSPNSPFRVLR